MESGTYFDQLRSNGTSLAAAARKAPDAAIAACPGWDMTTLVGHVGGVYRWAAEMVRTGALERISRRDMDPPPSDQAILVGWYEDALAEVTGVLEAADPDAPAWNWQPGLAPAASFWHRRMAHETAVHRWDAQAAAGAADPIDAGLAVDGIDEYFELFLAGRVQAKPVDGLHGSLHLHATDTEGEWWVALAPDPVERRHEHAKADAAVRGPASTLLLWLWNRVPTDAAGLQPFGDQEVMGQIAALGF
jgi:uncharacterized protein (TIGR03083 family)